MIRFILILATLALSLQTLWAQSVSCDHDWQTEYSDRTVFEQLYFFDETNNSLEDDPVLFATYFAKDGTAYSRDYIDPQSPFFAAIEWEISDCNNLCVTYPLPDTGGSEIMCDRIVKTPLGIEYRRAIEGDVSDDLSGHAILGPYGDPQKLEQQTRAFEAQNDQ